MKTQWQLGSLQDQDKVSSRLVVHGLSKPAAAVKAERFALAADTLSQSGLPSDTPVCAFFVPGRIQILGKHTDYAGGKAILAAAQQGICLAIAAREDCDLRVTACDLGQSDLCQMAGDLESQEGHWAVYHRTVARRIARNFPGHLKGADIAFSGDIPLAAGMGASTAIVTGMLLGLAAVLDLKQRVSYGRNIRSLEALAEYVGAVEHGDRFGELAASSGVGTAGGAEAATAMLCCRAGMLSQFSFRPVRLDREIKMPRGFLIAVAVSGVHAPKEGRTMVQHNRPSRLAKGLVDLWNEMTGRRDPDLASALGSSESAADQIRRALLANPEGTFRGPELLARFEHFIGESEQAVTLGGNLIDGAENFDLFGKAVERSQQWAENLLYNQVPETIELVNLAHELGSPASSSFGSGFGGSVWAMISRAEAKRFLTQWRQRYIEAFPDRAGEARFFATWPGPPACDLE